MIAEFYEDREIFFTGGSGVVGKSSIEKLLRSCNVRKIYILLRGKKGVSPEDRLEEIKKSRIFRVLNEQKPNELDKLAVIPGDTQLDGLGITPEHRGLLNNVSVFFHSAATTRFDEPLKKAIRLNVKSTLEALKLAETFENLKIFIHVSTFFSNPFLKYIENKVYSPVFDWKTALKILDEGERIDPTLDAILEKTIMGFPNTYLFTKHLAEQMVDEYRSKLPVGIYRPSIVVSALEEPEPGFSESSTGIMGLILVWGAGLLHVLFARSNIQIDVAPLDFSAKVLLMFTARTALLSREIIKASTPVSIFSSRGYIRYPFDKQCGYLSLAIRNNPFVKSIWIPSVRLTSCPLVYNFYTFTLELLPSMLIDCLLKLAGQKPFLMRIQRKIKVTVRVLDFFMNTEYQSDGVTDFDELVKIGQGNDFNLDRVAVSGDSEEHMYDTFNIIALGCRKFLLNEEESSLPKARQLLRWKNIVYNVLRGYVLFLVGRWICRKAMEYVGQ